MSEGWVRYIAAFGALAAAAIFLFVAAGRLLKRGTR